MGFETPEILFGLVGVTIPVLIHLLLRRRARVVPLDSVAALILSEGVVAVRLRWAHRALLAVRILLVALIAVTFARPFLLQPAEPGLSSEYPVALALVLDDSLSMQVSWGGTTSWARARERALRILEEVPPESEVFVVLASRPPSMHPATGPGWDARSASRFVARLGASRRASDLDQALHLATEAVRASHRRDRRIVIVSDFMDVVSGTEGFGGSADVRGHVPRLEGLTGVDLIPVFVGPTVPVRNATVVSATASPAPDVSPNHARVHVDIRNDGPDPIEPVVSVRLGLHSDAKKVSCAARAKCAQEFVLLADPGVRSGEVRLPPDDLNDDNIRYFTLQARDKNSVLLVNGAPRRQADLDEAFFLERALRLRSEDHPGFTVQTVTTDQVSALHLSTASVVGLLNVTRLPRGTLDALRTHVESGGGLLITAGENASGESWTEAFGGLLPAPIRSTLDLEKGGEVRWLDPDHPLSPGPGAREGTVLSARVRQVAILEPGWPRGTRILATLESGLPILVERSVGRGVVLAWLTSVDRDFTDFPLRPGYAPFFRAVFAYLTRVSGAQMWTSLEVGESRPVVVSGEEVSVIPPSGPEVRFQSNGEYRNTDTPGVYRVEVSQDTEHPVREVFVVNVDPSEGSFRPLDPSSLTGLMADRPRPVGTHAAGFGGSQHPVRKVPLSTYLVGILLGLFLIEAWLRAEA